MLVDFMLVGAQKCGTTSLAAQLAEHPDICFCQKKEPGFFNETAVGRAQLDKYHALYAPAPGQLCAEASTMYTFLPEYVGTAERLHAYNPNLKFIYMMRQPVDRIVSHYAHNLVRGIVKQSPEATVLADPAYVNRSRYALQIRPFLRLFPPSQIKLILFEEYISQQAETLRSITDFLGIDPMPSQEEEPTHAHSTTGSAYLKHQTVRHFAESNFFQSVRTFIPESVRHPVKRRLSNRLETKPEFPLWLRQTLWQLVEDDVYAVEQILGKPILCWNKGYTQ